MTQFTIRRELEVGYEEGLTRVQESLKREGFGILSEIDVRETLKNKIGADFRRYKILGACNPPLAHQALQLELQVGTMMPCNVVVYERDDGHATVLAIDPMQTMAASNPNLQDVARQVRDKLARALEGV